jgi:hypothetical protein
MIRVYYTLKMRLFCFFNWTISDWSADHPYLLTYLLTWYTWVIILGEPRRLLVRMALHAVARILESCSYILLPRCHSVN